MITFVHALIVSVLIPLASLAGVAEHTYLDNERYIEDIETGERLLAISSHEALELIDNQQLVTNSNKMSSHVRANELHESESTVVVTTSTGSIEVAPNQLFFNSGDRCWVEAQDIRPGQQYFAATDTHATILTVEKKHERKKVRELCLSYPNVFFIGKAIGLLTHNKPMNNVGAFMSNLFSSSSTVSNVVGSSAVAAASYGAATSFYNWMNNEPANTTTTSTDLQQSDQNRHRVYDYNYPPLDPTSDYCLRQVGALAQDIYTTQDIIDFKRELQELIVEEQAYGINDDEKYDLSSNDAFGRSKKSLRNRKHRLDKAKRSQARRDKRPPKPEKDPIHPLEKMATAAIVRGLEDKRDAVVNELLDKTADAVDENTGTNYASTVNRVYQDSQVVRTLMSDTSQLLRGTFNPLEIGSAASNADDFMTMRDRYICSKYRQYLCDDTDYDKFMKKLIADINAKRG